MDHQKHLEKVLIKISLHIDNTNIAYIISSELICKLSDIADVFLRIFTYYIINNTIKQYYIGCFR